MFTSARNADRHDLHSAIFWMRLFRSFVLSDGKPGLASEERLESRAGRDSGKRRLGRMRGGQRATCQRWPRRLRREVMPGRRSGWESIQVAFFTWHGGPDLGLQHGKNRHVRKAQCANGIGWATLGWRGMGWVGLGWKGKGGNFFFLAADQLLKRKEQLVGR